jgi:hypothetical protein
LPSKLTLFSVPESTLENGDEDPGSQEDDPERPSFAFPDLDIQIRAAVSEYGAVFPKLNFSSPRVRLQLLVDCVKAYNKAVRMLHGFFLLDLP